MGIFHRVFSKFQSLVKGAGGLSLSPMYGLGSFFSAARVSNQKLMQEAVNWVFACIRRTSQTVISERMRLYHKTGNGPEDYEEITDHPFLDLIQKPNKWMDGLELIQTWSEHEDLTGNAYWLLDGVTDETSEPTAIYPLNPAYMTVVVGAVASEPDQVVRYEYQTGATKRIFQPFEILHFRSLNPNDPFRGLGPTEASMSSVDTDNWMREWNRRFFQNSAIPGVVLETEITSSDQVRLLRESFDDRHSGVERSHKTVALPKGVKLAQMGYGQKDMDFVAARDKNRDEILAAFGVPPIVLGLGMGQTGINRATAEVQEYVFARYSIKPKLTRFERKINEFFLTRFGDDIVIAFDNCVPKNVEQEIAKNTAALAGSPYMTVNEVRAKEGMEAIDGGDVLPSQQSQFFVPPTKKFPIKKNMNDLKLSVHSRQQKKQKDTRNFLTDSIFKTIVSAVEESKKNEIQKITTVDWLENWKAFVGRTTEQEIKMKEAMATYAGEMIARAKKNLANAIKGKTKKSVAIAKLLDHKEEVSAIIDFTGLIYQDILEKEGTSAAALVDAVFNAQEVEIQKALDKSIKLMANSYTDTTLDILKQKLNEGIDEGMGIDELTKTISEIGDWSQTTRAETVAKTESFRTANFATKEAWRQSEVVSSIKWYTAEDERVCEDCSAMDGKVVGIEDNFLNKGDSTATGTEITYADVGGGSLHVNCRCYIRPQDISID